MKKILFYSLALAGLTLGLTACTHTGTGKVVKADAHHMVVQTSDGTQMTLKTTPETTYQKKKAMKHGKHHHKQSQSQPLVAVDDMVEVVYMPSNNEMVVEEVTIWE